MAWTPGGLVGAPSGAEGDDGRARGGIASGNLQLQGVGPGRRPRVGCRTGPGYPAGRCRTGPATPPAAPATASAPGSEAPRPILPSEPPAPPPAVAHDPIDPDPLKTLELKPRLIEALSTVYDPEIPVNIYELGLIYDVDVNAEGLVGIRMTLTSPACPAAQSLPGEVKAKAKAVPGVSDAWVDVVWEPQWDMNKMSDAARLQLGLL